MRPKGVSRDDRTNGKDRHRINMMRNGRAALDRLKPNCIKVGPASLGLVLMLAMAGCGRIGLNDPLASTPTQTTYEPLPAAPTSPVTSSALPPPPPVTAPTASAGTPVDPAQTGQPPAGAAAGIPVASANAPKLAEPVMSDHGSSSGPGINRSDFLGAWTISSGTDSCKLYTSLTQWSGGMRASTKSCTTPDLQRISAWDVMGKQIALKAGDGSIVATLTVSGQEKYAGVTTTKLPVSLSR